MRKFKKSIQILCGQAFTNVSQIVMQSESTVTSLLSYSCSYRIFLIGPLSILSYHVIEPM